MNDFSYSKKIQLTGSAVFDLDCFNILRATLQIGVASFR
jgi:hypothetical protein